MRTSKHYRPDSVYQDRAGTRYTVTCNPVIRTYHLIQLQPNGDRIANSSVVFTRWMTNLIKYVGPLPMTEEKREKV